MSNSTPTPNLYGGAAAPGADSSDASAASGAAARWTPGGRTALLRKTTYGMVGAAGLLLVGAGAGFFLISGKIQAAQAVENTKQQQVGSESAIAKKLGETTAAYDATEDQLKYLEKSGPSSLYVPTLLPQMQKLAASYGCSVKSLTPGAATNANGSPAGSAAAPASSGSSSSPLAAAQPSYQTMTLNMSLSGTYNNVMSFIYHLTRFPKMLTLKSIAVTPAADGGGLVSKPGAPSGPTQVSAQITLLAYIFTDDGAASQATPSVSAGEPKLGSFSSAHAAENDVLSEQVQQPVGAAMSVQQSSSERVQSAGLQAQPTPPTLPTNPALRK